MVDLLILLRCFFGSWFKSRAQLEAEILMLRHQINILRRKAPKRVRLGSLDRLILATIYRLVPATASALSIVRPATVIRLHRLGFRAYWSWKSRPKVGRPVFRRGIRTPFPG